MTSVSAVDLQDLEFLTQLSGHVLMQRALVERTLCLEWHPMMLEARNSARCA
jgi:hypothetical protein